MPFSRSYSRADKALHYLAFTAPIVQRMLCEIENDLFERRLEAVTSREELFVTGLPRAGTTLMLELLYGTGEFAAFTYRYMPFILAPMIWSKLTNAKRQREPEIERAHGDGVHISLDSPEAFEEVVWLAHLRTRIVGERTLTPLSPDMIPEEFAVALRASIRKVLALSSRPGADASNLRYLSKNNANISRLSVLGKLFPDSKVLVVFRQPAAQVSSLQTQHRRFLREHAEDAFSRRYMRWIGHYEFGQNLKPINFFSWLDEDEIPQEPGREFWMKYWTAAYSYALEHKSNNVFFVDFDRLLSEPGSYLERVAEAANLEHVGALTGAADALRSPTTSPVDVSGCRPAIRQAAEDIHARLQAVAI